MLFDLAQAGATPFNFPSVSVAIESAEHLSHVFIRSLASELKPGMMHELIGKSAIPV